MSTKERKRTNDESPKKVDRDSKKTKTTSDDSFKLSDHEIFNLEVEQSKCRDPTADLAEFKGTVNGIRESLSTVRQLKKGKDATAPAETLEHRILTSLSIAKLRKLNRLGHLGCARAKDATSEKRGKNDQYHLRLQNLLYEVGHLQKEINKCLEFRSKDEELSLVNVEKFYSDAPATIAREEVTRDDPHEQRKARLQWELEERKILAEQLSEARQKIDKSQADVQKQESDLESLNPKLQKILEATRPVQDYLGMPLEHERAQYQLARYLPQSLYVLYRNINSLETHDYKGKLEAVIEGDEDAAKQLASQQTAKDEDSDSEKEDDKEDDKEEETSHKQSKHRRRMTSMTAEDPETRVLKRHPLSVSAEITCQRSVGRSSAGVKVQLSFYHMTSMDMVTVKGNITGGHSSSIAAGDLMHIESIFSCLYEGDRGDTTPTPYSQAQLDHLTPCDLLHYRSKIGTPYKWAQSVSGYNTLESQGEVKLSNVSSLISKITKLVLDRAELVQQISELERCNLSVPMTELLPITLPTTQLHHWSRIPYDDFSSLPHAADYVQTGAVNSDCIIYMAKMSCNQLKVIAYVCIHGDYPSTRPIVLVQFDDNRQSPQLTRLNSDVIMSIESEVNVGTTDSHMDKNVLNLQVLRLAWCVDIYMAVLSSHGSNVNIKFVPNTRRGRERQLPFTYNPHTGFFGHD